MRINAINGVCCAKKQNKPSFKKLIKDNSALNIINNMSENDKIEFKQIEKRLSKTTHWDLKILSIGNQFKEFSYQFIDKMNKHGIITGGIHPYHQIGKTISIYSIIYGPENISKNTIETLRYKSKKRAADLYEKYVENTEYASNRGYNITPLESLKMKEVELSMLEEAVGTIDSEILNTGYITKNTIGNDLK